MKIYTLEFKWTVSRGQNTYGYNICSLYVNGDKVSSCNGGGYDMEGTAFGNWVEKEFQNKLKGLDPEKHYGMRIYEDKVVLDGACGFFSMEKIVNTLGYKLQFNKSKSKNIKFVLLIDQN